MEENPFDTLEEALKGRRDEFHRLKDHVPAAVLVPLFVDGGREESGLLLIKRTDKVKEHKHQVSFPGGVAEPGETPTATALRESFEELGLDPERVRILGLMEPVSTVSTGFLVHPVVGMIPHPYPFRPCPREVAEIIPASLGYVRDLKNWSLNPHPHFHLGDHLVWGATARIILKFVNLLFDWTLMPDNRG